MYIEQLCEQRTGECSMKDNSILFKHSINKLPINRVAKDYEKNHFQNRKKSFNSSSKLFKLSSMLKR